MNLWKIVGGAVIGVGAVAAAPFTGGGSVLGAATLLGSLAGAGTIAAAATAAGVGAVAGAVLSDDDKEKTASAFEAGRATGLAENALEIEKIQAKIAIIYKNLEGSKSYYDTVIALNALGLACANCDGTISQEEIEVIRMFVSGSASASLPQQVTKTLDAMASSPPNIKEAYVLAQKSNADMTIFDDLVSLVVYADGVVHEQERAFMHSWGMLRSSAA
jgi:uncharacterized tellurite resistance protein B-like protein